MKKTKTIVLYKVLSLIIAIVIIFTSTTTVSFASDNEDPTGFGVKNMSYAMAVVSIPLMNYVFSICNVLAGCIDIWTPLDGNKYKDLSYGDRDCQKYDLYIPKSLDKSDEQGLIIFIHGGTWTMGDKSHMAWECSRFAKMGYITATINYDLASQGNENVAKVTGSKVDANVFDMLNDVTMAINAIKDFTTEMGYIFDSLALSGVSAGSHISALYAYTRAEESPVPLKMIFNLTTPVGFFKGTFDNYTDAEVAQYASIVSGKELSADDIADPDEDAYGILSSISPTANISNDSVPTLLGYAGKDKTIGTNQYNTIKSALDTYCIDNDVVWWKNCDHTLIIDLKALNEWMFKTEEWLKKYM